MIKHVPSGRMACSIVEAAKLLGVSRRTVYNWISKYKNKVELFETPSGRWYIFVDSLYKPYTGSRIRNKVNLDKVESELVLSENAVQRQ